MATPTETKSESGACPDHHYRAMGLCPFCGESLRTRGQLAYEIDCVAEPMYPNGKPRAKWHELTEYARDSWERNPTGRAVSR